MTARDAVGALDRAHASLACPAAACSAQSLEDALSSERAGGSAPGLVLFCFSAEVLAARVPVAACCFLRSIPLSRSTPTRATPVGVGPSLAAPDPAPRVFELGLDTITARPLCAASHAAAVDYDFLQPRARRTAT